MNWIREEIKGYVDSRLHWEFFVKVFVLLLFVPTFLQEELLIVDLKKKSEDIGAMVADSDKTDQNGDDSESQVSTTSSTSSSMSVDLLAIISSVKKEYRDVPAKPATTKPKPAILPPEVGFD